MRAFQNVFANGFGIITPRAQAIIGTLAAIEIALAALFWALRGEDFTAPFLRKLLRIGFFAFLVASWPTLTRGTAEGLSQIGSLAGGGTGVPLVNDPSRILDQAMVVIKPIQDEIARIQEGPWYQKIAVMAVVFQYTIAELFVLAAFFVLALTCL
ncbi:P-type conjugative transfer protein TrbL, partial [Xanthomonas vasicola pv. vasculorum]